MIRPDYATIVADHWGESAPDWILALADACQASSQSKVALQIRYSAPVVSSVLRQNYNGTYSEVEKAVRGALMNGTVECPELGSIPGQDCVEHKRNSKTFLNTNPHRRRMFRACRKCPLNQTGDQHD